MPDDFWTHSRLVLRESETEFIVYIPYDHDLSREVHATRSAMLLSNDANLAKVIDAWEVGRTVTFTDPLLSVHITDDDGTFLLLSAALIPF